MSTETVFAGVGFDESIRASFTRLVSFLENIEGCGAYVYQPPRMRQARAAHVLPGEKGRKNAQQVFLLIDRRHNGMLVSTRGKFTNWQARREAFHIDPTFNQWEKLESKLKEWSLMAKPNKDAPTSREFGDGVALPGGLPMTKRSKF